ncbi:MAG: single-stranded DNA-binding protein [Deltaproteobacteria bacterium]|nr:single-stranded DNA-binding protein [Deltaproteobacteria bacterium]
MASKGLNKVMLIGNLGFDPELKYTQGNQAVLRLRLATNESYKTQSGEWQERTEWHTVIVWGKRGEALQKLLRKGSQIYIEGGLRTRQWEDKEGHKRSTTEINANEVILLDRREGGGGGGGGARRGGGGDEGPFGDGELGTPDLGGGGGEEDDIPF